MICTYVMCNVHIYHRFLNNQLHMYVNIYKWSAVACVSLSDETVHFDPRTSGGF